MTCVHNTIRVKVWADVDERIAPLVAKLNSFDGITTHASCQGTMGEGGAEPYGAYVMASWRKDMEPFLLRNFKVEFLGECWGKVSPVAEASSPAEPPDDCIAEAFTAHLTLELAKANTVASNGLAEIRRLVAEIKQREQQAESTTTRLTRERDEAIANVVKIFDTCEAITEQRNTAESSLQQARKLAALVESCWMPETPEVKAEMEKLLAALSATAPTQIQEKKD